MNSTDRESGNSSPGRMRAGTNRERKFPIRLKHFKKRPSLRAHKTVRHFPTRIDSWTLSEAAELIKGYELQHPNDFTATRLERLLLRLTETGRSFVKQSELAFAAGQLFTLVRLREGDLVDLLVRNRISRKTRSQVATLRNEARRASKGQARTEFAKILKTDPGTTKDQASRKLHSKYHVSIETMNRWLVGVKTRAKS